MTGTNKVEVTILGQSYLLVCPAGGEQALLAAVDRVDREMSAIRDAGKIKARERMAVLAALNLAYELTQKSSNHALTPAMGAPTEPSSAATASAPAAFSGSARPTEAGEDDHSADTLVFDNLIARIDQSLGHNP
jgi:cell division protein ZapA